ncbi:MAG TPA: TetR/AcrR family transcriptional regulator [Candidatus Dorea intestinavium]|nr:TetR/AcrR family transcriptional regulator [Candidatus Dorea intestinavium]
MKKKRVSKAPEMRKAEIITAARELFDLEGIEKTRISDIVAKVGVAKGVFYYYFSSKDEIIETILLEIENEMTLSINEILKSDTTIYRKIFEVIALYLDFIDQFTTDTSNKLPDYKEIQGNVLGAKRVRTLLMNTLQTLIEEAATDGLLNAPYPLLTLNVLECGFMNTKEIDAITAKTIYSITENALAMPKGALTDFIDQ